MQPNTMIIPQPMSKGKLKQLLNGFSTHTVQSEIIDSIATVRKVSLKEAKDTKTVYPGEVEEVLKRFK
jgi:hypothetical protein